MAKMTAINNFLYFLSSTDKEVIAKFPSEASKRLGIGMMIFCNSLLIACAIAFSSYYAFNNYIFSVFFGIVFATILMIINLYVTGSISRRGWFSSFLSIFPLFAFAVFIGFTASFPMQILIFDNEINQIILERTEDAITNDREVKEIVSQLQTLNQKTSDLQYNYIRELDGSGGTGKEGLGPRAQFYKTQIEENKLQIDKLEKKLQDFRQTKKTEMLSIHNIGLLSRLGALEQIKKENPTANILGISIVIIFVLLELLPHLFVLFSGKSSYDVMVEKAYDAINPPKESNESNNRQLINSRIDLPTFNDGFFSTFDIFGDSAPTVEELKGKHETGVEADVNAIKNDWKFVNKDWRNVLRKYGTRES